MIRGLNINFISRRNAYKDLVMPQARYFILQAVEKILERFGNRDVYICESGLTPSGKIHLGNFFDICIADAVKRALEMRGLKAKHIMAIDSMDPFRQAPVFAPKEFIKEADNYVGLPFDEVPDPWGCHKNYAMHFVEPLISVLDEYGIDAEIKWAREIHILPKYLELLQDIISKRREVVKILNDVRSRAGHKSLYPSNWIPFRPQCSKCRRIDERVKPKEVIDTFKVKYVCEHCGNEDIADIMKGEGKPPWRIDWPLRWLVFGVVFEPLGKDHMASGSSYDTARVLVRELYGKEPPVAIFYD
ncbi:MAG: lysine--tRNA ligase, partial [Thermoprotei archaeon]